MAFAPRRDLVGVPSSSTSRRSIAALVVGVEADQRVGDLAVDVTDRPRDALPEPGVAAVAELDRLVLPGRGAGRHERHAERTGLEADLDLHRRISPRVDDLTAVHVNDRSHDFLLFDGPKTIEGSWAASAVPSPVRARSSFAAWYQRSCASRSRPAHASPASSASCSACSTRATKRAEVDRRASSGSTFTKRATLTTVKRRSPTSAATAGSGSVSGAGRPARPTSASSSSSSSSHLRDRPLETRPVVPGRSGPALHLPGVQESRKRRGDVVEDPLTALPAPS